MHICIRITDSLCCIPESNTKALLTNYTPKLICKKMKREVVIVFLLGELSSDEEDLEVSYIMLIG